MTVVALVKCAAGNGEIGTIWTETAIFESNDTIGDILHWYSRMRTKSHSKPELILSIQTESEGYT